jgi:hypothetical protein
VPGVVVIEPGPNVSGLGKGLTAGRSALSRPKALDIYLAAPIIGTRCGRVLINIDP